MKGSKMWKIRISAGYYKKEQAHHSSAGGKSVSCCLRKADLPKTVARRLRGGELYARRPVVRVPLTRQHRAARLQWCREHHNWTEQDWACVLFSDESRFSLSSDCRRQLIWRESGTAYRPENIQEKDRYPTCSIMVWVGIMINGRTHLHVVANGTMTGQRYIDEVLLPHVRLFRGAVGDKFVFMDDNATCHRTLAVQDCLDSEGIQRFVWPARSPDLNPIENVWDALGRQVAGRNYPPTNKNSLIRALTEEWDKLPQQLLDNVVQSMVCGNEVNFHRNGDGLFISTLLWKVRFAERRAVRVFLRDTPKVIGGRGSLVLKASDRGWNVTSSSPVQLKTRRICVFRGCAANYSKRLTCRIILPSRLRKARASVRDYGVVILFALSVLRPKPLNLNRGVQGLWTILPLLALSNSSWLLRPASILIHPSRGQQKGKERCLK
ncbi:transposable element Tcb2 transposase [Trichonephila clavipes]|nr:transposable element Tcb2 transposase [Trichonephila clavipes]